MTEETARLLLSSLLDRMEADIQAFRGLVSVAEREALKALLHEGDLPSANPVSQETHKRTDETQITISEAQYPIDTTAVTSQPADNGVVFCLDFGTAKSKAFAARKSPNGTVELIELGIGQIDDDIDGSVYTASSALWIDEDGRAFVGSEAIRQSLKIRYDAERARVDSLKQFVSQAISSDELRNETLNSKEDPTGSGITQEEALLLYLGYLTDLATSELERQGYSRYTARRFAMPCWKADHREWAGPYLSKLVARAQVVADTFRGSWRNGIPIDEALRVLRATEELVPQLDYLLAKDLHGEHTYSARWGAVLEPIASASANTWAKMGSRALMLVVDVGAGTTDVALFWVNRALTPARAFPILGTERAIRMAGDHVDEIVLKEILDRGHVDPRLRSRAEAAIRISGLRPVKERLFREGSVDFTLLNDETVTLSLSEFATLPAVERFGEAIRDMVGALISGLDPSWSAPAERIALVLTGGGATLPMVADLAHFRTSIGQTRVSFVSSTPSPEVLAEIVGAALVPDYAKLAVSIGGCVGGVDERMSMKEYAGAAPPPGRLERFPTRGV